MQNKLIFLANEMLCYNQNQIIAKYYIFIFLENMLMQKDVQQS